MTTSESPTHPDAPRAGGETPTIDLEATLSVLRIVEYDLRHRDEAPEPNATSNEIHAEFAQTLAILRAALPSLLERHRDGERESFEARVGRTTLAGELRVHRASVTPGHFVARHVPSSIDACELSAELAIRSVLRELDAAMSASPDPERASK